MKKALLIGAVLMSGVAGFAQNNRQSGKYLSKSIPTSRSKHMVESQHRMAGSTGTQRSGSNNSVLACPAPQPNNGYTSGPNFFGVGGGATTYQQNCLSYNKDLNSYLFTHRRSAKWATTNAMGSGAIQGTWINVSTLAKDSSILYYEATPTNPARYPSGTFYNPAGNTTWSNVWLVGSGPALVGNGSFNGAWHSTRHLTGTTADHNNPGTDKFYETTPAPVCGTSMFLNNDMVQVGTRVLVSGENADTTTSTNPNHSTVSGGIIAICDFTTGSPVWSHDSIIPGYYFNRDNGGNGYAVNNEGGRIAFGPGGTVGYWVSQGRLANTCNNSSDSMLSPIVYKTTNGGVSWNPVLTGYDWSNAHPELGQNVGQLASATWARHWKMSYRHGLDVTVDANNVLHLVGTMEEPYTHGDNVDSIAFGYVYTHDYINYHPIMWDLMTDGTPSYGWKTMLIDSIASSWVGADAASDTTAAANPLSDGSGGKLNYGSRLQVSRSYDGTKIFYSWADSDPSSTGVPFNIAPDIIMKAYDVNSGMTTLTTNVTNGLGVCWAHMMADIAYVDGSGNWVAPSVYTIPRTVSGGIYDGTSISDHYWMDCGTFAASDFVIPATVNAEMPGGAPCGVNIKNNNSSTFLTSVSNYPNPFNGTTNIVVKLNEAKSINVSVFDAIGNMVSNKTVKGNIGENTIVFDAAGLNAGVYYYTVTAGYEKTTKKMVIQK